MIFKTKLTYIIAIAAVAIFIFLSGGIKYSHITWMCAHEISCFEENIAFFGFYYERIYGGKLTFTETNFGWRLSPSLRIFSINKMIKY
jgi:hypothetical protein